MTDFTSNQASEPTNSPSGFGGRVTRWLAGITGVLVVVPSLINAGADVYVSVLNIPRTHAEAVNKELYEKYFGKEPIERLALPLQTHLGEMNMVLEVHGADGDIFVQYGSDTQWFRSPLAIDQTASNGLFRAAFAQAISQERAIDNFSQVDKRRHDMIVRERYYADGTKERYIINPRTGAWSEPNIEHYEDLPPTSAAEFKVRKLPGIDLRGLSTD